MDAYYLTFQSMTQAQTAASILRRHGLIGEFLRAPKLISSTGCGYALQLKPSDLYGGMFILKNEGMPPKKVFQIGGNNHVREVFL